MKVWLNLKQTETSTTIQKAIQTRLPKDKYTKTTTPTRWWHKWNWWPPISLWVICMGLWGYKNLLLLTNEIGCDIFTKFWKWPLFIPSPSVCSISNDFTTSQILNCTIYVLTYLPKANRIKRCVDRRKICLLNRSRNSASCDVFNLTSQQCEC